MQDCVVLCCALLCCANTRSGQCEVSEICLTYPNHHLLIFSLPSSPRRHLVQHDEGGILIAWWRQGRQAQRQSPMAESSSARHEPKALRRPTPQPDDNTTLEALPRPQSGASTGSTRREGWFEQQRSGVAGPSRPRPASGASARSQQTAYRVPHDEYNLAIHRVPDEGPADSMGTPSIERRAPVDSPARGTSRGARSQNRSSRGTTGSRTSRTVEDGPALGVGSGEEDVESRPGTGKWLQQKRSSRGTRRPSNEGVNELRAPEPVQNRGDSSGWVRQGHMEDEQDEHDNRSQQSSRNSSRVSALPPPSFRTRQSQADGAFTGPPVSSLATSLYVYSYLIFFSILGTLARLGVQWLTFYPGAPLVTDVTWANVGGSLIMGFLSEDRQFFREEWGQPNDSAMAENQLDFEKADQEAAKKKHAKVKKTIPLYIGLATGFCGSFTSFSSFMRDVFLALSNNLPTPDNHPSPGIVTPSFTSTVHRNGGYSFMALLAVMLYTVALSLAALFAGAHLAIALDPWTPTIPFKLARKFLDPLVLILGPGCWIGAIFLAIWPPDRPDGPSSRGSWSNEVWRGEVLFALVFAPVGCLLRYFASVKFNGILVSFPLGTFAVNIFGCAIEAMCYDIQHVSIISVGGGLIGGGRVGCQVLQGIMDGFCGCLTTVSTWVAELQGLRRRHAYMYGLVSLLVGLGIMIIIMGSVRWTVGFSETACVTMRTSS